MLVKAAAEFFERIVERAQGLEGTYKLFSSIEDISSSFYNIYNILESEPSTAQYQACIKVIYAAAIKR
jgi:hypothetical protein